MKRFYIFRDLYWKCHFSLQSKKYVSPEDTPNSFIFWAWDSFPAAISFYSIMLNRYAVAQAWTTESTYDFEIWILRMLSISNMGVYTT